MSVFTKIINGELPGRFVWQDQQAVAFLSIAPITAGHVLVVPREEIDRWTDAAPNLLSHCMGVAAHIGEALRQAWDAPRAGLVIAGFEVAHLHLHVFPAWALEDFNMARADPNPNPADLDEAAIRIRNTLHDQGHGESVPTTWT